jgi:hypothetical protein
MKLACISLLLLYSQITSSQQIVSAINKRPQEKIYLQLDKPYYAAADSIWFSAWLVNADTHMPDTISRILYTELISPDNTVIMSHKLRVDNGLTHSDFKLPDSLRTGIYQVRAYTSWMRNFDNDYFFKKDIPIYGLISDPAIQPVRYEETSSLSTDSAFNKQSASAARPDLRFFPEGGYLVNGLVSTVGFKAVDINGNSFYVKGLITDEHANIITSFESNESGMGAFQLRPEQGKTYYAKLINQSATGDHLYPLPNSQLKGYVITVNSLSKETLGITIQYAGDHTAKELWLTGETRGTAYFASKLIFQKDSVKYSIPKSNFPTGITHITLFENDIPVCERLVFVDKKDFLAISITPTKELYAKREKVTLDIKATDQAGNPVTANLSLAVTDASQVIDTSSHKDNILSYLLLHSELKGTIENPGQYFSDDSVQAPLALDHLLLTQGWRRYRWDHANTDSFPPIKYDAEEGFTINGKIATHPKNRTVTGNSLSLLFQKGIIYAAETSPAKDSTFNFDLPDFYDSARVVIQTNNVKGRPTEMTFSVDQDLLPEPTHFLQKKNIDLGPQSLDYINNSKQNKATLDSINAFRGKTLGEVIVTAKEVGSTYARLASVSVDVEAVENEVNFEYLSIFHLLLKQIPGSQLIQFPSFGGDILVTWHGPIYLLNDTLIHPKYLFSLDLKTVKVVKFIPRGAGVSYKYVSADLDVIGIYTYPNGYTRRKATNIHIIKLAGFYQPQEFYSPLYDRSNEKPIQPDLRSTIYWNPSIQTDSNGKAAVTFYTSDRQTPLNTIIEGISTQGIPGRREKQINKRP